MAKIEGEGIKFRATEQRWSDGARQRDATRRWANRKLDEMRADREAKELAAAGAEPAGKAKPKRSKARGSKKASMIEAAARTEVNKLVPKEAQRNGDYQLVPFTDVEVTEGGKRVKKEQRVVRNLGQTQIERWNARHHVSERQMAAILFYQAAWRQHIGEPRVTANYCPAITRNAGSAIELWASSAIRAKEALRLLDQEVFFRLPVEHFEVWQNVVIWDEPSGVAGGRVGFCHKPGEAVAKVIVLTIAGMIADIVIDSSRQDFGDLLVDLDAPRRAGRAAPRENFR